MVWQPEVDELQRRHKMAEGMGGAEGIERQRKRGKLTVRERLALLADPGSFREMGKLQGQGTYHAEANLTDFTPIAQVSGLAKVNGRRVFVRGSDFTIRGGSGNRDDGGVDIARVETAASKSTALVVAVHEGPKARAGVTALWLVY